MLADSMQPTEAITDIGTFSGGGANGIWSWTVAMELMNTGYGMEMVGGSSTGCIVAFLYAKGFFEEADQLYRKTYEEGSRNIFEPGIASIKKGKIDINWLKAIPNVFRIRKVKSLMTQNGLYETFMMLQKKKPGWDMDMFFNTTSLATGLGTQHSVRDYEGRDEELCRALTASTAMPVFLPWWDLEGYKTSMDGGITDGLPFRQMFARMIYGQAYRFWNTMCNPIDMLPANELQNIAQIGGRTLSVMMNKCLTSELGRTQDKNDVAKIIWPITEKLDAMGLTNIADELRGSLGYKYMPIHNIIYTGSRGTFEFTMDSYYEQIETAKKDVKNYLANNKLMT
jgi:predicted acylesterase/phospholipase RssA